MSTKKTTRPARVLAIILSVIFIVAASVALPQQTTYAANSAVTAVRHGSVYKAETAYDGARVQLSFRANAKGKPAAKAVLWLNNNLAANFSPPGSVSYKVHYRYDGKDRVKTVKFPIKSIRAAKSFRSKLSGLDLSNVSPSCMKTIINDCQYQEFGYRDSQYIVDGFRIIEPIGIPKKSKYFFIGNDFWADAMAIRTGDLTYLDEAKNMSPMYRSKKEKQAMTVANSLWEKWKGLSDAEFLSTATKFYGGITYGDAGDDMAYNIYVLGKGVCADKTDAMCRMLKAKGIECVEAASDTHAWLFVKLNGQWTQCDPTDSLVSGSSPIGAFYTRHANATDITKWPECIEIPGL